MVSRSILVGAALASLLDPRPPALSPAAQTASRRSVIVGFHPRRGREFEGGKAKIREVQDHFLRLIGRCGAGKRIGRRCPVVRTTRC